MSTDYYCLLLSLLIYNDTPMKEMYLIKGKETLGVYVHFMKLM